MFIVSQIHSDAIVLPVLSEMYPFRLIQIYTIEDTEKC